MTESVAHAPTAAPTRAHIVIAGHVDDGKSTIIGRLLADAGALPAGKIEQVRAFCERTSRVFEYAFLVDALQDERAQGITIDAARVFFRTAARQYVLIDAPGHVEFLKNMITGAAPADAALLVVDAREGVRETTRRHAIMLAILGLRQVAILVNKMDLVQHSRARFDEVARELTGVLARLDITPVAVVPISGREGDNVAVRSAAMPWYDGPTVLDVLNGFTPTPPPTETPFRLPVQGVYKFTSADDDRRIVAGTIESGRLRVGDEVVFYPSRLRSRVRSIEAFNAPVQTEAAAGVATGFTMDPQVFAARGDVATRADEPPPRVATRLRVTLFCLGRRGLDTQRQYLLKLGTARVPARIERIDQVLQDAEAQADDLVSHEAEIKVSSQASTVERHQIAQCILRLQRSVACDRAADIPALSRFALVDDYEICGGGIVRETLDADVSQRDEPGYAEAAAGFAAFAEPALHAAGQVAPLDELAAPAPLIEAETLVITPDALAHLRRIARRAGDAILAARGGPVTLKADGTPVTPADMAAHHVITEALAAWEPSIPIVSEEAAQADAAHAEARRGWRRFWLVDPLDGTKEFAAGRTDYAVCIALIEDGVPVLSAIHAPAQSTTWSAARGLGSWRQTGHEPAARIAAQPPAAGAGLRIVESRSHPTPALEAFLASLPAPVVSRTPLGSALKFCWLAEGRADIYARFGRTHAWDVAAGDALFRYATFDGTEHPSPIVYDAAALQFPGFVLGFVPLLPAVVWLTGLPGAGKSTIANALVAQLHERHARVELLDGDDLRRLFPSTGFSRADRDAHIRRVGHLASRLEHHGVIVVAALVSPYRESRAFVRGLCRRFIEVHVSTPLETCEQRDPKGLYARARRGEAHEVTGVDDPYEPPAAAELTIDTSRVPVHEAVQQLLQQLSGSRLPGASSPGPESTQSR